MANSAFNKKKAVFTSKMDLNLIKKPIKCYIWIIALHCTGTWILRKNIRSTSKVFKCAGEGCGRSVGPLM
jgi:hypothetical protein